ncbi:MAG: nucleotidyltransferase [Acidobacteriota bacterium]|nr:nucleotidyltransferase [Acidobacteriota bacterium]
MNPDFKELLKIFNEHAVKYLIVGGYAVMKYTEPRFTKDLDIFVEASPENGKNVFQALKAFGSPLDGLTENDFAEAGFYQMGRPPVRVDILMTIDGVDFQTAWTNRVETDFDGVTAYFISPADLIENKKASGRLQDLADIEKITLSQEIKGKLENEA